MAARADDPPFRRIGIVGLGLIGGSIALAARRAWTDAVEIVALDRAEAVRAARAAGAIDAVRESVLELRDVDLVVLAVPVPAIISMIDAIGRAKLQAVITDVGSTKRDVMRAAAAAGVRRFVGGHPMAGSERGGWTHARANLFDGRPWALVSEEGTPEVETFVAALGATPRYTDAALHDRAMAFVSHAPQLLASALMNAAGQAIGRAGLEWSGQGFADMTRLASSPAEVWDGILRTNADFIVEALAAVASHLPATTDDLTDAARTERLFADAAAWRELRRS